ncbi:MAG: hypothetical protein IJH71_02850 [Eubacterium sp.]|nr:hypothetical protein [Eubacterium sp.]
MNVMIIIIILLLISSACMAFVAVRSGTKKPVSSGRPSRPLPKRPDPVPVPGKMPDGPSGGIIPPTEKPAPAGGLQKPENNEPAVAEDIDILYQYSREYPVWVCGYCETENRLEESRCAVCNERNDRG